MAELHSLIKRNYCMSTQINKFILFFFISFLAQLSFGLEDQIDAPKICVLSFFEENSNLQNMVNNTFSKYQKAKIFNYAQISDIEHCMLSGRYEEVVWLAHGNSVRNSISSYSAPILIKKDVSGKIHKFTIPDQYLEKLAKKISTQTNLTKFRIAVCGYDEDSKEKTSNIDILIDRLRSLSVNVDILEKNTIQTYLRKEPTKKVTYEWLAKSISKNDYYTFTKWSTDTSDYCESDDWPECNRALAGYVLPK